jgi:hypothetical protein
LLPYRIPDDAKWKNESEERQIGLTPLESALVSGGLPMTYKEHNSGAHLDVGLDNTISIANFY